MTYEEQVIVALLAIVGGSLLGNVIGHFIITPLLFKLLDKYDEYKENKIWKKYTNPR